MKKFLLDTNCISEIVSPRPRHSVISFVESVEESSLYLSVLTLGEIRKGVALLPDSRRRTQLASWLESELKIRFAGRLLPVDDAVADIWGNLAAGCRQQGIALSVIDGLIASTALHHELTLVTRNTRDFPAHIVPLFDPWDTTAS